MADIVSITSAVMLAADEIMDGDDDGDMSDDFMMLCGVPTLAEALQRKDHFRVRMYVETVVPRYTFDEFRRFFRMSRGTFEEIYRIFGDFPEGSINTDHGGRLSISLDKQLLITLWYLGGQETLNRTADRFNVTEFSILKCRNQILGIILTRLKSRFITWPTGQDEHTVRNAFQEKKGFPDILGAIDASHIRISAPRQHSQVYVNRKKYHSIILQAVCREDKQFTHCFTGWPGSCHDSRVCKNSDLWQDGLQLCGNGHIIGDGGYPLRRWLLTPYRDNGHLTPTQKHYNYLLSSTRQVIEHSFALLKGRFRRLLMVDVHSINTTVDIIMACCVLHNICILNMDNLEEFMADGADDVLPVQVLLRERDVEGVLKRDILARNLP